MALCNAHGDIDDDDEFFGNQDDSDVEYDGGDTTNDKDFASSGLALHESRAREERMKTIGYLDAYDANKDTLLQEGFEKGYRESIESAMRIGESLGKASALAKLLQPSPQQQQQQPEATNTGGSATVDNLQQMTAAINTFSKTFEDTEDPENVPSMLEKLESDLSGTQ